jgi:hypothetical protein
MALIPLSTSILWLVIAALSMLAGGGGAMQNLWR